MSLNFLQTQGFQTPRMPYTKASQPANPIFSNAINAAQTIFQNKMTALGFPGHAVSVWDAFNIEGIPGPFSYEKTSFEALKVVHLGASHTGGFLQVCQGNDALAELFFGLLAVSYEEALATEPPRNDLAYSCFVERSNTNWTQVSGTGDLKTNVLKNTYNVYRIFITPKLGSRGMSPAVLYGCKIIQSSKQPQQQAQQLQQPQQQQPQFQLPAQSQQNQGDEVVPF
jgi:hypothetical protein